MPELIKIDKPVSSLIMKKKVYKLPISGVRDIVIDYIDMKRIASKFAPDFSNDSEMERFLESKKLLYIHSQRTYNQSFSLLKKWRIPDFEFW